VGWPARYNEGRLSLVPLFPHLLFIASPPHLPGPLPPLSQTKKQNNTTFINFEPRRRGYTRLLKSNKHN
jgi:hypothetical protein